MWDKVTWWEARGHPKIIWVLSKPDKISDTVEPHHSLYLHCAFFYSHPRTHKASMLSSKSVNNQQPPRKTGITFSNSWLFRLLVTILPVFYHLPWQAKKNEKEEEKSDIVLIWIILPTKLSPWLAVEFVSHPSFQNCGWQLSSTSSRCQVIRIIPWGFSLHPLELLQFWCPHPPKAESMFFLPGCNCRVLLRFCRFYSQVPNIFTSHYRLCQVSPSWQLQQWFSSTWEEICTSWMESELFSHTYINRSQITEN